MCLWEGGGRGRGGGGVVLRKVLGVVCVVEVVEELWLWGWFYFLFWENVGCDVCGVVELVGGIFL